MPSVPTPEQLQTLPHGARVETPLGTVVVDHATGQHKVQLNDLGRQRYAEAHAQATRAYGSLGAFDTHRIRPDFPQPPVAPGKVSFNPFTGKFAGGA